MSPAFNWQLLKVFLPVDYSRRYIVQPILISWLRHLVLINVQVLFLYVHMLLQLADSFLLEHFFPDEKN